MLLFAFAELFSLFVLLHCSLFFVSSCLLELILLSNLWCTSGCSIHHMGITIVLRMFLSIDPYISIFFDKQVLFFHRLSRLSSSE